MATKKAARKAVAPHVCPGRGKPCGYDLSGLMAKGPKDGQEHQVTCPECQTIHGYVAPKGR